VLQWSCAGRNPHPLHSLTDKEGGNEFVHTNHAWDVEVLGMPGTYHLQNEALLKNFWYSEYQPDLSTDNPRGYDGDVQGERISTPLASEVRAVMVTFGTVKEPLTSSTGLLTRFAKAASVVDTSPQTGLRFRSCAGSIPTRSDKDRCKNSLVLSMTVAGLAGVEENA
jgi:hypothetical protein